jgi:predicted nuclease of restriction endonuclease-like (RecB) superfamily
MTPRDDTSFPAKTASRTPAGYGPLLGEIKARIRSAQYEALRAVNKELIALYWDIGRMIVERQGNRSWGSWGQAVVENLARDLRDEFPGVGGFSRRNIFYMRELYLAYSGLEKVQPLVAQIGWTHNLVIMEKCKDPQEREFYIRMTKKFGWTKNVLAIQIEGRAYERTLRGQTNFDRTLPARLRHQAKLAVKDEYTFDFLELGDEHSEKELERAILMRVESFLREMGGRFAFLGSQYRLEIGADEYFLDLLLYHRGIKCLVAVELKIGPFKPEYVGKMQFYLAALDDLARMPGETPSIGMIICRTKERAVVEYALRESNKPIGVASYRIVRRLPKELAGQLPDPRQIEQILMRMGE